MRLASSTNKKVIVVRFDREPQRGYVSPETYLTSESIELLTEDGNLHSLPFSEIKAICFVKSWEVFSFEKERKEFTSRPKTEGLWVKFHFRDGDAMESLIPNRLHEIDSRGFSGTPPDASSNIQRLFIPRKGLLHCNVLGVVGVVKRQSAQKKLPNANQLSMFD